MSRIEELKKKIKELDKQKIELQKELEIENQKTEIEYPFEENEIYFTVSLSGEVVSSIWTNHNFDTERYSQGNAFKTKEAADRERDRRILLTRFRQFRDKCNGDWKPDFKDFSGGKYSIKYDYSVGDFVYCEHGYIGQITQLGYFKNRRDCNTAIELFGDEIKRLFLEEE